MTCSKCESGTKVVDSRVIHDKVRRRRECKECETRFSTIEVRAEYHRPKVFGDNATIGKKVGGRYEIKGNKKGIIMHP